jgi:hypothetical protein
MSKIIYLQEKRRQQTANKTPNPSTSLSSKFDVDEFFQTIIRQNKKAEDARTKRRIKDTARTVRLQGLKKGD